MIPQFITKLPQMHPLSRNMNSDESCKVPLPAYLKNHLSPLLIYFRWDEPLTSNIRVCVCECLKTSFFTQLFRFAQHVVVAGLENCGLATFPPCRFTHAQAQTHTTRSQIHSEQKMVNFFVLLMDFPLHIWRDSAHTT